MVGQDKGLGYVGMGYPGDSMQQPKSQESILPLAHPIWDDMGLVKQKMGEHPKKDPKKDYLKHIHTCTYTYIIRMDIN